MGYSKSAQDVSENGEAKDSEELGDLVEDDDLDWEEGEVGLDSMSADYEQNAGKEWNGKVTLEVEGSAVKSSAFHQKLSQRRATAKDKEFSEMVHKAHLLCLLARGRIVDAACNDPNLQAAILSVLPAPLGLSFETEVLNMEDLEQLVGWFMKFFHVLPAGEGSSSSKQEHGYQDFSRQLQLSFQKQAGSAEEVAALAVALLRGLGFTTRYVTVLNVTSLKPDADSLEASRDWRSCSYEQGMVFSSHGDLERNRVASLAQILACSASRQLNESHNRSSFLDSERSSPSMGGKSQEGRERDERTRGGPGRGHTMNESGSSKFGESVVLSSKSATTRKGKGQRTGIGHGKTGSASGSHEVHRVANEPEVKASGLKRSGDEELERHLAMAITATGAAAEGKDLQRREILEGLNDSATLQPLSSSAAVKLRGIKGRGTSGNNSLRRKLGFIPKHEGARSGGAVWSRKLGPVMHWTEIYCGGKGIIGQWVHLDAARGIVNGADKIESAAAACHLPLRYVVAFAGSGAKDVTRRYVTLWSTVSSLRVDNGWWEDTLSPLKQLEAIATAGPAQRLTTGQITSLGATDLVEKATKDTNGSPCKPDSSTIYEVVPIKQPSVSEPTAMDSKRDQKVVEAKIDLRIQHPLEFPVPYGGDRSAFEDMEMETKTFTEPLPTNQQAYKSHHLYVIERWLTKYQTLHPKGPVLGYCAGHPVYPRTCVQVVHTPDRWLREGFKVKSGESPAKVIKASRFTGKVIDSDFPDLDEKEKVSNAAMTSLYGKWQTEAWQAPCAINGIVPKNERGQVDVWSEKCIPFGTVHLRLPRLVPIAQKLEIDFAPAMVGFEVHKGRPLPVYEGIVVCEEFKDVILDAYKHQEEVRYSELQKKREEHASKRWWHLLHSMSTRRRLQESYEGNSPSGSELKSRETHTRGNNLAVAKVSKSVTGIGQPSSSPRQIRKQGQSLESQHIHYFPEENQSCDNSGIQTKKCSCGFTFYVEKM